MKYFITVAGVLVALACTALSAVAYRGCSLGRDPFNQRIFATPRKPTPDFKSILRANGMSAWASSISEEVAETHRCDGPGLE